MNRMINSFRKYIRNTSGTIVVMFAIMAPIIVGSAGMALDFAHAYLVQQRLSQAIDAAALAATAQATDEGTIEQKVKDFFEANYPEEKLGATFEPIVVVEGNQVKVTGRAEYLTFFLSIIGIHEILVEAETTVQREVQGIEVVLVLDNTGSMATENDEGIENIEALKIASRNFISTLFENTSNPETVKIGMVPYSNSVRIGRYGLGKNPDNTVYGNGDVFVNLPAGISYTTSHNSSSGWYGCVVEHKQTNYNAAATHVAGSAGQLWRTGSGTGCNTADKCRGHGWAPGSNTNDPYDYDVLDNYEGKWDIYMYGRVIPNGDECDDIDSGSYDYSNSRCSNCTGSGGNCNSTYCYCMVGTSGNADDGPNTGCPYAYVMPLTSDLEALNDRIDEMRPDGNTLGNIGMAWGYRLISPEAPFEEGAPWDNPYWRKVVVMMTDGDNTENSYYSSYWFTNKNNMSVTKFNTRFSETCEAMKEQGIIVYTVTFNDEDEDGDPVIRENTRDYYRNCASSPDQYYDAPTQEELIDVFEQISRELSNLHITG